MINLKENFQMEDVLLFLEKDEALINLNKNIRRNEGLLKSLDKDSL